MKLGIVCCALRADILYKKLNKMGKISPNYQALWTDDDEQQQQMIRVSILNT